MTSYTIQTTLACADYDCPMVLVQVKESLARIDSGEIIEVITKSTPNFQLVLKAWVSETNDTYYDSYTEENHTHHFIQKATDEVRNDPQVFSKVVTNDELKELISGGQSIHIIDVREDIEFMLGHIPMAKNVPLSNLTAGLEGFDKEITYYVICRTGNRSDFACKYMETLGFKTLYNVLPGMYQWDGLLIEEDL